MPDSSNNQEGFCGSKKCKTLSIIAVIILIIIIIAIAVPISLAGCKTGYTGEECDVCDTGYHMDNHGLCKGLKISFRTQISLKKYVGIQSWKAAHLPTLEIRVEQKRKKEK